MTQVILPPNNSWKILVPETAVPAGVLSPVLSIPPGTYKKLFLKFKVKDTINISGTEVLRIGCSASFTPVTDYNLHHSSGAVLTTSSVTSAAGVPMDDLVGTDAAAFDWTIGDLFVYDCDTTLNKYVFGRYFGSRAGSAFLRSGYFESTERQVSIVDGFRLFTTNARFGAGSVYEVWQIE